MKNTFKQEVIPDIYRGFQRVLVTQKRIDTALEVAEQGRCRNVTNILKSYLGVDSSLHPSLKPPSLDTIKQIAKDQNTTLVHYSVIYDDNQLYQAYKFRISFNQPYAYATALFIWVISPNGKITFREVNLKELWQNKGNPEETNTSLVGIIRLLRESIGGIRNSKVTQTNPTKLLQLLYKILIQPIVDLLPRNPDDRVTFIPQDFLFLVPFAALIDTTNKYLIENHTIFISPSIQFLSVTHHIDQQTKTAENLINALVIGNSQLIQNTDDLYKVSQTILKFPEIEREALAVAQILDTEASIGKEANKIAILSQLSQSKIIHLAAPCCLDEIEGLRWAIALAPNDSKSLPQLGEKILVNEFLTAREIIKLKLNASLVALTHCDLHHGKISSDGIIALSYTFITTGVPSLLMSLWSTPNTPTASLMTAFYQDIRNNLDKATALRQAMLKIMQKHPHPGDWAAFILIGQT